MVFIMHTGICILCKCNMNRSSSITFYWLKNAVELYWHGHHVGTKKTNRKLAVSPLISSSCRYLRSPGDVLFSKTHSHTQAHTLSFSKLFGLWSGLAFWYSLAWDINHWILQTVWLPLCVRACVCERKTQMGWAAEAGWSQGKSTLPFF